MVSMGKLFDRRNGICIYCDGETWTPHRLTKDAARERFGLQKHAPHHAKRLKFKMATKEHLVRIADGGENGANIDLACLFCNTTRGERTPAEHRELMLKLVAAGRHPTHSGLPTEATTMNLKKWARNALRQIIRDIAVEPPDVPR